MSCIPLFRKSKPKPKPTHRPAASSPPAPSVQPSPPSPHLSEKDGLGDTTPPVPNVLLQSTLLADEQPNGSQPPSHSTFRRIRRTAFRLRHKDVPSPALPPSPRSPLSPRSPRLPRLLPSLPSDIWMLVCDLLGADNDPTSRRALTSFMRTSSWAYHLGARSLYRTLEIGPGFLHIHKDLEPATRAPVKRSDHGRWCDRHGGWCAADDSSSPPSSIPAPIGKLALSRYTRTLIVGDVSKLDHSALKALIDRLGQRTCAHASLGPHGVSMWIGRRPALFGGVRDVRVTAKGYLGLQDASSAVASWNTTQPLLTSFLSAEATPQTLHIEQPSLADATRHVVANVAILEEMVIKYGYYDFDSALRNRYLSGHPSWATDLGTHWSLEPSFVARPASATV